METRSYNQFCSLARALDVIGGRWTLLLIRELLSGPKRFKDLALALRGIGTNLLTKRLRELEDAGVIRAVTLPPPVSAPAYALTDYGRQLEDAVIALTRWGVPLRATPRTNDLWLPGWNALAFKAVFNAKAAVGVNDVYEVCVDGEPVSVRVADGEVETRLGSDWDPDLTFETDGATFIGLVSGDIMLREAIECGSVTVAGPNDVLRRFVEIFGGRPSQNSSRVEG